MELSNVVQQFIVKYIGSVDQLEILLLLKQNPTKEWSAEEVARTLFTQPDSVELRLSELTGNGILAQKKRDDRYWYQYGPKSLELDLAVNDLEREYPKYRVTVINLIFSKPIDKIRTFADAFRFIKEDEEEK